MKVCRNSVLAYRCDENIPKQLFKHPGTRMNEVFLGVCCCCCLRSISVPQTARKLRQVRSLRQRVEYSHGSQAGSLLHLHVAQKHCRTSERHENKRSVVDASEPVLYSHLQSEGGGGGGGAEGQGEVGGCHAVI